MLAFTCFAWAKHGFVSKHRENFKILQPSRRMMQTGRSMIEMLGVLAIIGVLSIAGLWGYQLAIAKHKAIDAHVL